MEAYSSLVDIYEACVKEISLQRGIPFRMNKSFVKLLQNIEKEDDAIEKGEQKTHNKRKLVEKVTNLDLSENQQIYTIDTEFENRTDSAAIRGNDVIDHLIKEFTLSYAPHHAEMVKRINREEKEIQAESNNAAPFWSATGPQQCHSPGGLSISLEENLLANYAARQLSLLAKRVPCITQIHVQKGTLVDDDAADLVTMHCKKNAVLWKPAAM